MGSLKRQQPELFNTPFELGLRMVYLLFALRPTGADLQKLVLLDYAIIYSKDVGPFEPAYAGAVPERRIVQPAGTDRARPLPHEHARLDRRGP